MLKANPVRTLPWFSLTYSIKPQRLRMAPQLFTTPNNSEAHVGVTAQPQLFYCSSLWFPVYLCSRSPAKAQALSLTTTRKLVYLKHPRNGAADVSAEHLRGGGRAQSLTSTAFHSLSFSTVESRSVQHPQKSSYWSESNCTQEQLTVTNKNWPQPW